MDIIYNLLDLMPFEFTKYIFMKNALIAVILIAPMFALLGTMAVNNKMAFFSDALGHSAFTGIALGVLLGLNNPVLSMIAFGIFLGLAISTVKQFNTSSTDTIISVFSSASVAIGLLILSKNGGFAKYSSYLIGDILTIEPKEIALEAIILVVIVVIWLLISNRLFLVSINQSLAASRGINCSLTENIFIVMMAVVVMISVKWVGILTINSLLILPAASARNISNSLRQYHFYALIISLASAISGLIFSFYLDTTSGAAMVICACAIFFLTLAIRRIRR